MYPPPGFDSEPHTPPVSPHLSPSLQPLYIPHAHLHFLGPGILSSPASFYLIPHPEVTNILETKSNHISHVSSDVACKGHWALAGTTPDTMITDDSTQWRVQGTEKSSVLVT